MQKDKDEYPGLFFEERVLTQVGAILYRSLIMTAILNGQLFGLGVIGQNLFRLPGVQG